MVTLTARICADRERQRHYRSGCHLHLASSDQLSAIPQTTSGSATSRDRQRATTWMVTASPMAVSEHPDGDSRARNLVDRVRRGPGPVGIAAGRSGSRRRPGARGDHPAGPAGNRDPRCADRLPLRHDSDLPDPRAGRRRGTGAARRRQPQGGARPQPRIRAGRRLGGTGPTRAGPSLRPTDVRRSPGLALTGEGRGGGFRRLGCGRGLGRVPLARRPSSGRR